jgi:D-alanine--poly(phosphoribitol) ligase subunit 1
MLACFLGCAKAGCSYVPLDDSMPPERLEQILAQLGETMVLSLSDSCCGPLAAGRCDWVDAARLCDAACAACAGRAASELMPPSEPGLWANGEDILYIIFTSGSTGLPKGVQVTAANHDAFLPWARLLAGTPPEAPHGARAGEPSAALAGEPSSSPPGEPSGDASGEPSAAMQGGPSGSQSGSPSGSPSGGRVFLNQAPFSFDLSVFEISMALAEGGTVFSLTREDAASSLAATAAIAKAGVDVWISTPSFAEFCLKGRDFSAASIGTPQSFIFCGEVLLRETASQLLERFPGAEVVNTFGPTEATVAVTDVRIGPEHLAADLPLPVGRPKADTEILVIAPGFEAGANAPVCLPPGEAGEIVIAGPTVSRGYYGRDDLTANSFFDYTMPGGGKARAYRTGDSGFLDDTGMLHYKGRLDFQVKIHGYRVELGDIEKHLRSLQGVANAVVLPSYRDGKVSHLVACILDPEHDGSFKRGLALKEQLGARLPAYMVPRLFRFFEEFPLNANGKIDRKALGAMAGLDS